MSTGSPMSKSSRPVSPSWTLFQASGHIPCFKDGQFDGAGVDRTLQHLDRPELVIEGMARTVHADNVRIAW